MKIYDRWTALVGSALNLISPAAACRYHHGREVYRTYLAGETKGPDNNFRPRTRTVEADIRQAGALVTARCRDQYQNNSYIAGGVERMIHNVVRGGIRTRFQLRKKDGELNAELNAELNKQLHELRKTWARRYMDVTGQDSERVLQKLILRHQWIDGGILIHRVIDDSVPGVVPLRLEFIETAQLDKLVDGTLPNGNTARRGIEADPVGRPVAYHVLDRHPGDYMLRGRNASRRILAEDIIHVYDRRFASQYSGISWLAAVVMEAFKMHDYRNIEFDGARTAAAFVAFVESTMPGFQLGLKPGGQADPSGDQAQETDRPSEIRTNMIQYLPAGTKAHLASHNRPGNNYEPFIKDSLRSQSTGLNMSFEAFANNYSDSTYASARSGSMEERLSYRDQQLFLVEKPLDRINLWFLEAAVLARLVTIPGFAANKTQVLDQLLYELPGWPWVDPRNDSAANKDKLEMGGTSHQKLAADAGTDFTENMEEQIEAYKLIEKRDQAKARATGEQDGTTQPDN